MSGVIKVSYSKKLQENQMQNGAKCNIVQLVTEGIQQRKNTKTITKAILSTFQFTLHRCSSALAECSLG